MSAKLSETFIKKVNEALKIRGWTKAELAEKMGKTRALINNTIGPQAEGNVTLTTVEEYAKALGFSPVDLLREEDEPQQTLMGAHRLLRMALELCFETDEDRKKFLAQLFLDKPPKPPK